MKKTKRKPALPPEARDNLPRLSVTFTDESCWLTRYDAKGAPGVTYPVAVQQVANAFKEFGASTGLLASDTLWWNSKNGATEIAIWLPPVARTIQFRAGKRTHTIKLPPLGFVFVGKGKQYYIFATGQRPARASDTLYRAPLSNVNGDGNICQGSVAFPIAKPETMAEAARLFFESYFNHDLSDGKLSDAENLLKGLQSVHGKKTFPMGRLVRATTIGQLVNGRAAPHYEPEPDLPDDVDPFEFANREDNDDELD